MPRFEITYERSAVHVCRLVIEAADEAEAEDFAEIIMTRSHEASPVVEAALKSKVDELVPDDESVWEHVDTDQLP